MHANTHTSLFTLFASLHYHIHNTEVDKQRKVFKDLTNGQEKVASNLKIKLDDNERVVSSKEEEISSTRVELALLEQKIAQYKASTAKKMTNLLAETDSAKHQVGIVKEAYERAQKAVNDFNSSPDDELIAESKRLDEMEKELNRECDEMIEREYLFCLCMFVYTSVCLIPLLIYHIISYHLRTLQRNLS